MNARFRTTMSAIAIGALATLTIGALAPSAQAHGTPRPGSPCQMSGMAQIAKGKAYVCTSAKEGAKPAWGTALTTKASPLKLTNGWVKAADSGMSAAFGTLTNPTKKPITVVGAVSAASPALQLHEVVEKDGAMVMQQKPGGFVIPAGGSVTLAPGGNHIMLMSVTTPITAGAMMPLTLITSDGGLLRTKVMGKVFTGANESYDGSGSGTMSGM